MEEKYRDKKKGVKFWLFSS